MRWFGVARQRIAIVPNGVDDFFSPAGGSEEDYILFAGTLEPRKGIADLLAVWESLPAPRPTSAAVQTVAAPAGVQPAAT